MSNGEQLDARHLFASCLFEVGVIQGDVIGKQEEGLTNLREARSICQQLAKENPLLISPRFLLGMCEQHLGALLQRLERYEQAAESHQSAIEQWKELIETGDPQQSQLYALATGYRQLGQTYSAMGSTELALREYDKSTRQWRVLAEQIPANPDHHHNVGAVLREWAQLYDQVGRRDDAIRLSWESAHVCEALAARLPDNLPYQQNVVSVYEDLLSYSPQDPRAANRLAWMLTTTGQEPLKNVARALELARVATMSEPENSFCWYTLGAAYYRLQQWEQAAAAFEKASRYQGESQQGFPGYFLAMNAWRLNLKTDAVKIFRSASMWMDQHSPRDVVFQRLKEEAATLLAISQSSR